MSNVKKRFFFYSFFGLFIYACAHFIYSYFRKQKKSVVNVKQPKRQQILFYSPDDTCYFDFSWYQKNHTRPQYKPNSTLLTTHLSWQERQQLQERVLQQTKKLALRRFPPDAYQNIQGTSLPFEKVRHSLNCWTRGQWVEDENAYQLRHIQDPIYTCKSPLKPYRWQPDDPTCPPLKPVDTNQWCHILNGRHILLVGDLVHYQYHEALLDAFRDEPTVCYGELNCKDHTICKTPKETRLRYIRNDILSTDRSFPYTKQHGYPLVNSIQLPFLTSNIITNYPIVILSRRSIINEDDMTFARHLIQSIKVLLKTSPNTLVIYKSSFIGHPFCNDAQQPLSSISDDELKRLPFGWSETKRRNAIAKVVIEAAGGIYLDFASLMDLRPDGHVGNQDCSRYCIPGPLDATVQILYNLFLLLQ